MINRDIIDTQNKMERGVCNMIKLAILGTENSHSWYFSSILAPKTGTKVYHDVELIGVYGDKNDEKAQAGIEEIKKMSSCKRFADHYNDFLDEADAVMITASYGARHLEYAESYLKKGKFVWVDKPITCDPKEALKMWELAREYCAVLCGGSTLRYDKTVKEISEKVQEWQKPISGGNVSAPLINNDAYGGFWFYSQHLVEMMITIFGTDVKSVYAKKFQKGMNAVYHFDGFSVTAFYGGGFSAMVYLNGVTSVGTSFKLCEKFYEPLLDNFYKVLKDNKTDKTKKEFIAPVYIIDATIKSFTEEREVEIDIPND